MKLNLGCGVEHFHLKGWVNVDCRMECLPDILHDVVKIPWFVGSSGKILDSSVTEIRADNLLEHIPLPREPGEDRLKDVLNEAHRVLVPRGRFWIRVPDVLEWPWGAFRDPTHCRFWTEGSFDYWNSKKATWRDYGKSYGYLPWEISITKFRNPKNGAVFLDAVMLTIK